MGHPPAACRRGPNRAVGIAACCLLALLAGPPALAQVSATVTPAAGGLYRAGSWSGIRVDFYNSGAAARVGAAASHANPLAARPAETGAIAVLPERTLPGGGARSEWLYLRATGDEAFRVPVVTAHVNGTPERYQTQRTPVRAGELALLGIGPGADRLLTLQGELLREVEVPATPWQPAYTREEQLQVATAEPDAVPDRWPGLDPVDALVLGEVDESAFTPEQRQALRDWVTRGGHLIVTGGASAGRLRTPFFSELLPVEVTALAEQRGAPALERYAGASGLRGTLLFARSTPRPGSEVLAGTDSAPALATWRYGMGRVSFLALDLAAPPFREWEGAAELWRELLLQPVVASLARMTRGEELDQWSRYRPQAEQYLARAPFAIPQLEPPRFGWVLLFLVGYLLALSPLQHFILRRADRRDLAWLLTPLIVAVFTAGAFALAYTTKGTRLVVVETGFIQAPVDSAAGVQLGGAGVFSPRSRRYQLSAAHPGLVLAHPGPNPWQRQEQEAPSWTLHGGRWTLDRFDIPIWSMRAALTEGTVPLGEGFVSELRLEGGELTGEIVNRSGMRLRDCFLLFDTGERSLGDWPDGAALEIEPVAAEPPAAGGLSRIARQRFAGEENRTLRRLNSGLTQAVDFTGALLFAPETGAERPVIIGWAEDGPDGVRIEGDPRADRVRLYLVIVHL